MFLLILLAVIAIVIAATSFVLGRWSGEDIVLSEMDDLHIQVNGLAEQHIADVDQIGELLFQSAKHLEQINDYRNRITEAIRILRG